MSETGFDWNVLRERIAKLQSALSDEDLSDEATAAILHSRAAALARQTATRDQEHTDGLTLISFRLDRERYGIGIRHLLEIQRADSITPIPGVRPFVVGVISLRGAIITVLSPGALLGLPLRGWGDDARVLIVHAAGKTCGMLIDQVDAVLEVPPGDLHPPLAHGGTEWHRHITHLTSSLIHVLDPESLFQSADLIV
jgi:purine-binding chemotaxis protein CheW